MWFRLKKNKEKSIPVRKLRRTFDRVSYSAAVKEGQRHFCFPILYRPNRRKKERSTLTQMNRTDCRVVGFFSDCSVILVPFTLLKLPCTPIKI